MERFDYVEGSVSSRGVPVDLGDLGWNESGRNTVNREFDLTSAVKQIGRGDTTDGGERGVGTGPWGDLDMIERYVGEASMSRSQASILRACRSAIMEAEFEFLGVGKLPELSVLGLKRKTNAYKASNARPQPRGTPSTYRSMAFD